MRFYPVVALLMAGVITAHAADGVWVGAGSGLTFWNESSNWSSRIVPGGADSLVDFSQRTITNLDVSCGGQSVTLGSLNFAVSSSGLSSDLRLISGTFQFDASISVPEVHVSGIENGVYFYTNLFVTGRFKKTGDKYLILKEVPKNLEVEIAEGTLQFAPGSVDSTWTNVTITGTGDLSCGRMNGVYRVRILRDMNIVLGYTGRTIIEFTGTGANWYYNSFFTEVDGVLPPQTILDMRMGSFVTRYNTVNGMTVAGITGGSSTTTWITTDAATNLVSQNKWTINVDVGKTWDYAGVIGSRAGQSNTKPSINVTKKGLGTQIFSGPNNFLGGLFVDEGTLLVNNTEGSGSGMGNAVSVESGARFGGTGQSFSKSVTLKNGGVLIAGSPTIPATFAMSNLVMQSGAVLECPTDVLRNGTIRTLDSLTLPDVMTVKILQTSAEAIVPGRSTLFMSDGVLSVPIDFSGWTVMLNGEIITASFTYNESEKRIEMTLPDYLPADGVWGRSGAGSYIWNDSANWVGGQIARGVGAKADFTQVGFGAQTVSLNGETFRMGQLDFAGGPWTLVQGDLTLPSSAVWPVVSVADGSVKVESNVVVRGSFRKTGGGELRFVGYPQDTVEVAEGVLQFASPYNNSAMETTSITGPGDVQFGNPSISSRCRFLMSPDTTYGFAAYSGSLAYTGRTIVNWKPPTGVSLYQNGSLWIEVDDLLPHATVLELVSGNVFTRNQTTKGLTVAGLVGTNETCYISVPPASPLQLWTVDTPQNQTCEFYGFLGPDRWEKGVGRMALTKKGLGTQVLASTNNFFMGPLTVSNGTLLVKGPGPIAGTCSGTGQLSVASGAVFGGVGRCMNPQANFNSGAGLQAGMSDTVGELHFTGNMSIGENVVYTTRIGRFSASSLVVDGSLVLPSALTVKIEPIDTGAVPPPDKVLLFGTASIPVVDLGRWTLVSPEGAMYDLVQDQTGISAKLRPRATVIRFY